MPGSTDPFEVDPSPEPAVPSPRLLGFTGDEATGWSKDAGSVRLVVRLLDQIGDLFTLEALQVDVFGVTERDVIPASELVVVPETGGAVVAAFAEASGGEVLAGALFGWGGFLDGVPRIVSDFLAVRPPYRGLGIGTDLKRLQAIIAARRGFHEIVWTVDPLRAANAKLNVAKLGATSRHYERNRYGEDFGSGLYGGLPSDRLHMVWDLNTRRTHDRLLGRAGPPVDFGSMPPYSPGLESTWATVAIPKDIDALLVADAASASEWRLRIRSAFESAFADGWEIREFASSEHEAAYVLARRESPGSGGTA